MSASNTDTAIFTDGVFTVTCELVTTPHRFYPVKNTTAKIRRDPLWFALGLCGLTAFATIVYGDLLLIVELILIWGFSAIALGAGCFAGILSIDAIGHHNTMIVARIATIKALYAAIIKARSQSDSRDNFYEYTDLRQ